MFFFNSWSQGIHIYINIMPSQIFIQYCLCVLVPGVEGEGSRMRGNWYKHRRLLCVVATRLQYIILLTPILLLYLLPTLPLHPLTSPDLIWSDLSHSDLTLPISTWPISFFSDVFHSHLTCPVLLLWPDLFHPDLTCTILTWSYPILTLPVLFFCCDLTWPDLTWTHLYLPVSSCLCLLLDSFILWICHVCVYFYTPSYFPTLLCVCLFYWYIIYVVCKFFFLCVLFITYKFLPPSSVCSLHPHSHFHSYFSTWLLSSEPTDLLLYFCLSLFCNVSFQTYAHPRYIRWLLVLLFWSVRLGWEVGGEQSEPDIQVAVPHPPQDDPGQHLLPPHHLPLSLPFLITCPLPSFALPSSTLDCPLFTLMSLTCIHSSLYPRLF